MSSNDFPAFQIGKGITDVSIAAAQGDEYAQGSLAGQIVTILVTRKAGSFAIESGSLAERLFLSKKFGITSPICK